MQPQTKHFVREFTHRVGGEVAQIKATVVETSDQSTGDFTSAVSVNEIIMPDGQLVHPRSLEPKTFLDIVTKAQHVNVAYL